MTSDAHTATRTKLYTNIGDARHAAVLASLPVDGVAIVDQDSIIKNYLRADALAFADGARIANVSTKRKIAELIRGYESRADYAIHKLAEGISEVAAAFYPAQVVLRMSGSASKKVFALECRAIKKAREEWGLSNIEVLVPYCRTPEEAKNVLESMEKCGLKQGQHGLKIQVSCDIPSNLILAEEYAKLFDGLSLGSYTKAASQEASEHDNPVVRQMLKEVIALTHKHRRTVSFFSRHTGLDPDFVEFLVGQGIDSLSVDTDYIIPARRQISYIEQTVGKTGHATGGKLLSLVIGCAILAAGLINLGAGCSFTGAVPVNREEATQEITPAEIRAQITKEVAAQKDAERQAGRSKLKISSFVPLELMYPSGWNVEYWSDGVTLSSASNPNEYVSIFRQLISHPVSYDPSVIGGISAQKTSVPIKDTEEKVDIVEFPLNEKNYTIEINGRSSISEEIIDSIKLTDSLDIKVTPLLNHWDVREKRVCTKMAVFARPNKESGECALYTNPCDVPAGWHMCSAVDK